MIVELATERRWYCPNCPEESITHEPGPHSRFHACRGLRGLTAPMIPAGTTAKVTAHEREDYVGTEDVQLDPELGRPVMSVVTEREDGQDVVVFAPTAHASVKE